MNTLTKNQFKSYLKALDITHYCNTSTAQDEVGEILTIENGNKVFSEFAIIDRVEYTLTESQKDKLYNLVVEDKEAEYSTSDPFSYDDQVHALSLIY